MLLVLLILASCQTRHASGGDADSAATAAMVPRDAADSVLLTPRVITGPTMIVFWLIAADTISVPDQAAALDDLTYYTELVAPTLARHNVALVPTNADTIFVSLPNQGRRSILLSGLDYPFGYVLVTPGEDERVLAGVYDENELLDEVRAYFSLPADTASGAPRVTT